MCISLLSSVTTFSPNLAIKLVFGAVSPHILAIGILLGTVIRSDEVYISEDQKYIKPVHPLQSLMFFAI